MPWIGKSVISVRANSLSTDDSLSSLTTTTIQALRKQARAWSGRDDVDYVRDAA